jgi:5-hydroxyisourate hydrolase-like protein (transthyretin family)
MESEVDIRVFNVNGQEVFILHQGIVESGLHAISWNADKFSSGIYFIKFETNNFLSTQKVMLIK